MKNTVLFISYYFPPSGGGGVKRPTKFCKFLPKFGWHPIAFTVNEDDYYLYDDKFVKELPADQVIIRTKAVISKKRTDQFREKTLNTNEVSNQSIRGWKNKILWKLRDWLLIPDVQITWVPIAVIKAVHIVKKYKIQAIWTKCPPYSMLVLGALTKFFTGKPWIIDLADPWTTASYNYFPNQTIKRANEILEKRLFGYADKIVTVADNIVEDYIVKYPKISRAKYQVISNGYDLSDIQHLHKQKANQFVICHTGRIDLAGRNPTSFLKAVQTLCDEHETLRQQLKVLFIGGGDVYWKHLVDELQLGGIVQFTGNVPHHQCLQAQFDADVLLIIGGGSKYEQTGKIFEYLVTGNPTIALIRPDAPAAAIVNQTRTGFVVNPSDLEEIRKTIIDIFHRYCEEQPLLSEKNEAEIDRYNWNHLAKSLAALLEDITRSDRGDA